MINGLNMCKCSKKSVHLDHGLPVLFNIQKYHAWCLSYPVAKVGYLLPDLDSHPSNAHNTQVLSNPCGNYNSNLLKNAVFFLNSHEKLQNGTEVISEGTAAHLWTDGKLFTPTLRALFISTMQIFDCAGVSSFQIWFHQAAKQVFWLHANQEKNAWDMHLHTGIWAEIVRKHSQVPSLRKWTSLALLSTVRHILHVETLKFATH